MNLKLIARWWCARSLSPAFDALVATAVVLGLAFASRAGFDQSLIAAMIVAPIAAATWRSGTAAGVGLSAAAGLAMYAIPPGQNAWTSGFLFTWFAGVSLIAGTLRSRFFATLDQARRDPLTGALNRRGLEDHLAEQISLGYPNKSVAIGYLDLDNFKHLNDTLGHQAGDLLLQDVTAILRSQVRERDLVARVGGDEFVIVLFGVSDALARDIFERTRRAINAHTASILWSVGVSLGEVVVPSAPLDPIVLLSAADDAMYKAKRAAKSHRAKAA